MWRERGDLLRTKYDSKKYERESVCKIFGETFNFHIFDNSSSKLNPLCSEYNNYKIKVGIGK